MTAGGFLIQRSFQILIFLAFVAVAAFGGSYILPSDEELVARAEAIGIRGAVGEQLLRRAPG